MIYLDLDGPMVNWTQGVKDLYSKNVSLKKGQTIADALGTSRDEMWSRIAKQGAKWWADLQPQPWAQELYDELCRIDEVYILTAPSKIPAAHAGKVQWMQSFFGKDFQQYIITKHKQLLAKPGDVLIDDDDSNILSWNTAGGIGITFPMLWNRAADDAGNPLDKVLDSLTMVYPRYSPSWSDAW